MNFTNEQQTACNVREGNYIVSASAGSGKTAVLTERAFQIINEGTKLNELLILTFTNLAAAEMRDRIRKKLLDLGTTEAKNIASTIDAANIQTYDAFALNLVKKYHNRLNLPKDVSLVDEVLFKIEQNKYVEEIFDDLYNKHDEKVLKLVNELCYKDDSNIKKFIITLCDKFDLQENKQEYIETFVDTYLTADKIGAVVDDYLINIKSRFSEYYETVKAFENIAYLDKNFEKIEKLKNINSYDELHTLLFIDKISIDTRGSASLKEYPDDKVLHESFNSFLKTVKSQTNFATKEDIIKQFLNTKENVQTILDIVKKLDEKMTAYKRKFNVFAFADIFKFAMKLVDEKDIQEDLRNKFKYIMIDEYQDTSDLQEKFINKIANNNVYVVGDVKQSIYRFRNANCDIFLNKFIEYGKRNGGTRLELPQNFRSRKEVVDCVNYIFERIMTFENNGVDYRKEHKMIHGNQTYLYDSSDYQSEMLTYSREAIKNAKCSKVEYEARMIATDIMTKKNNKYQVYDHEKKQLRDCEFKDFAILMPVKTNFYIYQKVFNEYQIPLFANYEKTISDNDFTLAFENIIKLIANFEYQNCNQFKHSFISVMRSFLIEANDEEVDDVGSTENYQLHWLYDVLKNITEQVKGKNLKEQILIIAKEFDIYNRSISVGDVLDVHSLLEYYYDIASQMDEMGYNIHDFADYFDDLKKFEISPAFSPNENVKDCVKLLSIHASKGLQFKICYFSALDHQFKLKDSEGKLIYNKKYGISIPNVNSKEVFPFINNFIALDEKKDAIREQIRLFYVALTRAEEKIIMIACPEKVKKSLSTVFDCAKFLDFLAVGNCDIKNREQEPMLIKGELPNVDDSGVIEIKKAPEMNGKEINISHASKELDADTNADLLLLGNKYHYYLEMVDFATLDTSFIKNEKDRRIITNFLSNALFKDTKDAKVMHEYSFYDEINNVSGVIDLLLVYDNHIDIIDFKLSHVDDEAYEKQVSKYKNYISQLSNLKIHTYVTGIMSGKIKQID